MNALPAGLLPRDHNIEIFADPYNFGKCYFLHDGEVKDFSQMPHDLMLNLTDELKDDLHAMAGLKLMGYDIDAPGTRTAMAMIEQYNYCNRGAFDNIPDIFTNGKKTREFVDCGCRGRCPGEGKVCSPVVVDGEHITHRELECAMLIGRGMPYKRIGTEMGFHKVTAVNSLIGRLRDKLHCASNTEIAIKVKELGFV
jgi:DNA-binding CsgD family transcriptional regulator